jgi:aspartyl-tRNA synthetase
MTYAEAMDKYGSDRPDLRFGMSFVDVSDILKATNYSIFRDILADGGRIKGFCVKGQAHALSKNVLQNEYALKIVPGFGAKGMTWMKVKEGKLHSNIVQFFTEAEQEAVIRCFNAEDGDVLMMIADQSVQLVNRVLCSLRLHVADRLGLIPKNKYSPVWITAFPLFELKDGEIRSQHHPFTMPDRTDFNPEDTKDLLDLKSRAYDIVINGEEIGGGSVRIHDMDIQKRIFRALGMSQEQANDRFGFFLKALTYGAPPHAGLALGMDRTISMILNTPSIRDVIAFPKNRRAVCPLTNAPAFADKEQLEELGLAFASDAEHLLLKHREEKNTEKVKEKISKEEVRHVAKLARLKLDDDEIELYQKDLNAILEYVETIGELDTRGIEPMTHVMSGENVWRADKPVDADNSEMLLINAPERENNYFRVPKIVNP